MNLQKLYQLPAALLVVLALMAFGFSGCVVGVPSITLPQKLSREQRAILKATRFEATIGVEEYKYPVYHEGLTRSLQETGLFSRVDVLSNFSESPTLIARVERRIHGSATLPIVALLSFGIIPQTVEQEWGVSFSLRSADTPDNSVEIEFRYQGPSTLGWIGLLLNLSPNLTFRNPKFTERFYDAFAYEIALNAPAIDALIARE